MFWHSVMAQRSCLPSGAHLSCKDSLSTAVKRWGRKGLRSPGKLFTCHHLLGLIWFHVTVILSCHFFRTGLRAASLLRIKRVRIVLEDDELQKRGGGGEGVGGTEGKVRWMEEEKQQQQECILPLCWAVQHELAKRRDDRFCSGPRVGPCDIHSGRLGDNRRKA